MGIIKSLAYRALLQSAVARPLLSIVKMMLIGRWAAGYRPGGPVRELMPRASASPTLLLTDQPEYHGLALRVHSHRQGSVGAAVREL